MLTPVFVEAWEGQHLANLQVCRMVMGALYKRRVEPLPFASTAEEVNQVMVTLSQKSLQPAICIVNTYLAEDLVRAVDRLIGDTPLLLLHREIYSFNLIHKKDLHDTSRLVQTLQPRLTVVCGYGSQTTHLVADRVAEGIHMFLCDNNFQHIESLSNRLVISSPPEL